MPPPPSALELLGGNERALAAVVLGSAAKASWQNGPGVGLALAAVLPVMHVSYGFGFWRRVVELLLPTRRTAAKRAAELPLSR